MCKCVGITITDQTILHFNIHVVSFMSQFTTHHIWSRRYYEFTNRISIRSFQLCFGYFYVNVIVLFDDLLQHQRELRNCSLIYFEVISFHCYWLELILSIRIHVFAIDWKGDLIDDHIGTIYCRCHHYIIGSTFSIIFIIVVDIVYFQIEVRQCKCIETVYFCIGELQCSNTNVLGFITVHVFIH